MLPIYYCYGVADTHHFKFIFEYIKMEQQLSYYDVQLAEDLSWEDKCIQAREILKSKKRMKTEKLTRAERSALNRKKHAEEQERKNKKTVDPVTPESTDNANLSSNENGEV